MTGSDLARSLIDAAAKAISDDGMSIEVLRLGAERDARKAVVAVLETLAGHHFDNGGIFGAAHINELRRLAAEVKSEGS